MQEIIEELVKCYDELMRAERTDIYYVAINKAISSFPKTTNLPTESVIRKGLKDHNDFLNTVDKKNDKFYNLCRDEAQKKNPERTEIIDILECFIGMLKEELPPFVEFSQMRKIFKFVGLNYNYQLRLFVMIVRNNALLNPSECCHVYLPDTIALLNYEYENIAVQEVYDILYEGTLEAFLYDPNSLNPLGQQEVLKRYEETKINYTDCQKACLKLDQVLSKRIIDVTEEDYKILIDNMEYLFFGDLAYRIIKQIKKYKNTSHNNLKIFEILENENIKRTSLNKEEKGLKKGNNTKNKAKKNQELEKPKKQTNSNQTIREISKYFDLNTLELKEVLSLDQIIYVLSLMYSINVGVNIIEAFLRESMREFKCLHPYAIYNQGYNKFKRLNWENAEVQEHLEMIEYILSEVNIFMCDAEKYESTKLLIEEEISELMRIINGNYTYEIEEAKKLLKTSEE